MTCRTMTVRIVPKLRSLQAMLLCRHSREKYSTLYSTVQYRESVGVSVAAGYPNWSVWVILLYSPGAALVRINIGLNSLWSDNRCHRNHCATTCAHDAPVFFAAVGDLFRFSMILQSALVGWVASPSAALHQHVNFGNQLRSLASINIIVNITEMMSSAQFTIEFLIPIHCSAKLC